MHYELIPTMPEERLCPLMQRFHPDDLNNVQLFGCYFSNNNGGNIFIGHGTYIAPNDHGAPPHPPACC